MSRRDAVKISEIYLDDAGKATRQHLTLAIQYWEKMEHNRWSNSVWAFSIFVIVLVLAMIGVSIFFYQFFQQPVTKLGPAEIAQAITRVVLFGTIVAFVIWGLRQAMRLWAIQQQLLIDAQERLGILAAFISLKTAKWLSAEDMTVVITALVHNPRSSSVTEAPSPTTPVDALMQLVAKAAQEKTKGH